MCTSFIVGIGFVFHEWRIYNKSTWMYSSFTSLELLILVLGYFTYGSCRNDMANYVPGLPTLQGITWLLGWGWPVSGWLEHGLSAMLMWQHDFWSRQGLHPVKQEHRQGKAQTSCTHPGRQVLGCCTDTQQHTADLQDGLSELRGSEPHVTAALDGCTELQNFHLEVTVNSSNGNDGHLNTNIPVADGNRPRRSVAINQAWNPWLLEDWSRILLHTVANYPIW